MLARLQGETLTTAQAPRHRHHRRRCRFGQGAVTGSLTPGKQADVIMVSAEGLHMPGVRTPADAVAA